MTLILNITAKEVGAAHLYEKLGQQGRRLTVPTYEARLTRFEESNHIPFMFAVTRAASDVVLRKVARDFGTGSECPPTKTAQPFQAAIHETKQVPFGLRLYESWCKKTISLKGTGGVIRTGILIHHGPARTEGCFTVAGGKRGFQRFRTELLRRFARDGGTICVYVDHLP